MTDSRKEEIIAYLEKPQTIYEEIIENQEEIKRLYEKAKSLKGIDYSEDKVQSSSLTGDANYVGIINEIEVIKEDIKEDTDRMIEARRKIKKSIAMLNDKDERKVLRYMYLDDYNIRTIMNKMHMSERTIYRYYSSALEKIIMV